MKKVLIFLLAVILIAPMFTGCHFKKGENDPTISIKSRKARLCGEWKLTEWEMNETATYSSGGSSSTMYNFNGSSLTIIDTDAGGSNTYTLMYSESCEILKDGTFTSKTSMSGDGYTSTKDAEGTWTWISGNKEDDLKNKERVCFAETRSTEVESGSGYSDTDIFSADGDKDVSVQRIDQLSNKILVFSIDVTENNNGSIYTTLGTWTYEKE
ncbi:MAG: hypothetical protein ABIJ97_10115 [Bacteroidota bacterium]